MHHSTLTTEYWARSLPEPGRDGVAVSQALRVLRRAWAWILIPTLMAAVAATAFVQWVAPRYTAETKVLLENRAPAFARSATERGDQAPPIDEQAVASQVQVVMSRDLAREAIRRLGLVGNPEFDPSVAEAGPVRRLLTSLGLAKPAADAKPEDRVLESYFERLLVYPVSKSRILSVEFRAGDPALAAQAADTVAELYIGSLAAASVDTARYASSWLGTNIDALRARVTDAEARVEAFRTKNGLIGSGGAAGQPIVGQQLGELSSQLSQARTVKADLTGRVRLLKEMIKEGRAFEIPDVANNELIRRTVESRMTLRAQLALESRTLLPAHPRIKELKAQLDDLEQQIKAAAERIVRTLENDARIAGARVDSLQAAVDGQRDVVAQGNSSEIQLRALEREAKAQREQLESYLSRYREAAARHGENAAPADARIVSRAVVPDTPSFPKKVPVVGLVTALAFMLSAASVLGRHLLRTPEPEAPARTSAPAPAPDAKAADAADGAPTAPLAARFDYPEPMPPEPVRPEAPAGRARVAPMPLPADARDAPEPARATDEAHGEAPFAPAMTDGRRTDDASETHAPSAVAEPTEDPDLAALIARLRAVPGEPGRCVLVVETEAATDEPGLARRLAAALCADAATLDVDLAGPASEPACPGLSDLVAGEAAFPEVIQAVPGSTRHAIGAGFVDREVLLEEPHALAIALNAMAQAYDWTVLRIAADRDPGADRAADAFIAALSAGMTSVVIASDADPADPALVALYDLAAGAGAGQVLVARSADAPAEDEPLRLRLSA